MCAHADTQDLSSVSLSVYVSHPTSLPTLFAPSNVQPKKFKSLFSTSRITPECDSPQEFDRVMAAAKSAHGQPVASQHHPHKGSSAHKAGNKDEKKDPKAFSSAAQRAAYEKYQQQQAAREKDPVCTIFPSKSCICLHLHVCLAARDQARTHMSFLESKRMFTNTCLGEVQTLIRFFFAPVKVKTIVRAHLSLSQSERKFTITCLCEICEILLLSL